MALVNISQLKAKNLGKEYTQNTGTIGREAGARPQGGRLMIRPHFNLAWKLLRRNYIVRRKTPPRSRFPV